MAVPVTFNSGMQTAVCHFQLDPRTHTETPTFEQKAGEENTLLALRNTEATPFNDLRGHLCGLGRERTTDSRRDLRAALSKVS